MTGDRTPQSQAAEALRRARLAGRPLAATPRPFTIAERAALAFADYLQHGVQLLPDIRPVVAFTITDLEGAGEGRMAGHYELPAALALPFVHSVWAKSTLIATDVHNLRLGRYDDGRMTPATDLARDAVERRRGDGPRRPALRAVAEPQEVR